MSYKPTIMVLLLLTTIVLVTGCEGIIVGEYHIYATPGQVLQISGTFEPEDSMWARLPGLSDPLYFWLYGNTASSYNRQPIQGLQGVSYFDASTTAWSWSYTVPTESGLWSTWDCETRITWFGGEPCICHKNVFTRIAWSSCEDCTPASYQQIHQTISVECGCPPVVPPHETVEDAYVTVYAEPYVKAKIIYSYSTGAKSFSELIAGYTSSTGYTLKIPAGNFAGAGDRVSVSVRLVANDYTGSGSIELGEGQSADLTIPMSVITASTTAPPTVPTTASTTTQPTTVATTVATTVDTTTTTTTTPWTGIPVLLLVLVFVWRLQCRRT